MIVRAGTIDLGNIRWVETQLVLKAAESGSWDALSLFLVDLIGF